MTMKRALYIAVVVLIIGAYVGGYWPEHRRRTEAETQVRALQGQLNAADARNRLGEVLGRVLRVSDAVEARNYGEAAALSSIYYDRVREEASRAEPPDVKQALESILQSRDEVTAALARTDPSVAITLREQELKLRRALGYPVAANPTGEQPRE
jgi:hypothetical protein